MKKELLLHNLFLYVAVVGTLTACEDKKNQSWVETVIDSTITTIAKKDSISVQPSEVIPPAIRDQVFITSVPPDSIVTFAKTLIGVPYLYASTDPAKGFDCSGFITYVFNHFNIAVPRSSVDFTNYGSDITLEKAKPGDLILFTGTDSTIRIVGHMGIVENVEDGKLHFIHSTSGKGKGVVITPFENYYQSRFVKVIRVFTDKLFD